MRTFARLCSVAAVALFAANLLYAQESPDTNRKIAGGGISVPGWQGKVDSNAEKAGQTVNDAKPSLEGNALHVAKGDYTVSAAFTEPKFMNLNTHPHPYRIVIAGNDLETGQQSYIYCAAYGSGNFIVRGFGPDSFQLNGRREANDAVHKAAGVGQPVTQEIAMQVKGDEVSCIINGTVVKTRDKSDLVVPGKLKSTDGVYGIRFAHNMLAERARFVPARKSLSCATASRDRRLAQMQTKEGNKFVQRMQSRAVIAMVTYTTENVSGLDVSSPVRYRGVPVGRVSNVRVDPRGLVVEIDFEVFLDRPSNIGMNVRQIRQITDTRAVPPPEVKIIGNPVSGEANLLLDSPETPPPAMELGFKPNRIYVPYMPSTIATVEQRLPALFDRAEATLHTLEEIVGKIPDSTISRFSVVYFDRYLSVCISQLCYVRRAGYVWVIGCR
jgi:hypothetical protein